MPSNQNNTSDSSSATDEVNAKKTTLKEKEALELAKQVNDIYAAKGKKVIYLNMKKDKPDNATLVVVGHTYF